MRIWKNLALLSALLPACAGAQTLTMALGGQVTSLDPHYHSASPNSAFGRTIFDRLTTTDANARLHPGLAQGWRMVDPTTWEFRLRPDVKFHNGQAFSADDVVFTFDRIPTIVNSPGPYTSYTRAIARVEVVDPLTIRIVTHGPSPLLPLMMSQIAILDRETHAQMRTEDFNAGRALVGTGPFRYVAGDNLNGIRLARNDAYWGDKPDWAEVDYRIVPNNAARMAALLAGDVDLIDQVPSGDLPRLRAAPQFAVVSAVGLRLMYINIDHSRTGAPVFITDVAGQPLAANPLKDARVRRALSLAIDRQALVDRVMDGAALASLQFMPPDTFGYTPDLVAPPADAAAARRLLAEAGYPDGFRITLHGSNNRFPNDARVVQAIGQMWTRIGVQTAVEVMPYGPFVTRASRQEFAAFLGTWGSAGEPGLGMTNALATWDRARGTGSINRGRYSNPALDAALADAVAEMDDGAREAKLQQVMRDIVADMPILPLYIQKNIWAVRKPIAYAGRADELTLPQEARTGAR